MRNSTILQNKTSNSLLDPWANLSVVGTLCVELGVTDKVAGGVVYGAVSLFGSLGNIFVILVICRKPNLRNFYGLLIANLAVADFIASATGTPLFYYAVTQSSYCDVHHDFAPFRAGVALLDMSVTASLLTLACLSFDRSFAICCPLKHKIFMTFTKLKVVVVSVWFVAIPFSMWHFLNPSMDVEYIYVDSALHTICFVVIIVSGVISVLNVIKSSSRVSHLHQHQDGGHISVGMRHRNKQVAKTVGVVVILFCLSWLPLVVSRLKNPSIDSVSLDFWFLSLGLANSAMNPCIYFYRHRNYREALKTILHC